VKPGDLVVPRKSRADLLTDIGFFTGQHDEYERKMIVWGSGKVQFLEYWEEKYYEVISKTR